MEFIEEVGREKERKINRERGQRESCLFRRTVGRERLGDA